MNNNSLYYENKTLEKRLKHALFKDGTNLHIKFIVRGIQKDDKYKCK